MWKPGQRGGPEGPEYVRGRGHFHSEALRMARVMTPAAIRRVGEFAGIDPDTGELIPLGKVDIDHRVMEIAALALVERTMGKAEPYDPEKDPDLKPKPAFDPRAYSDEELERIEGVLRLLMEPRTVAAATPSGSSHLHSGGRRLNRS
jgi:hypothetical protein